MTSSLKNLECITLLVEDLPPTKKFYQEIFSVKVVFEDQNCAVLQFENVLINLLNISEGPNLIEPLKVAPRESGSRMMFTIRVANVDSICESLRTRGVKILNGPIHRPWGRKTAMFCDPAGNAWEIAQEI